jgi:hypothetical protein
LSNEAVDIHKTRKMRLLEEETVRKTKQKTKRNRKRIKNKKKRRWR